MKFRPEAGQNTGKKPPHKNKGKHVTSVGVNTLAHAEALRANVSNVVIWITRSPIAQRPHGITRGNTKRSGVGNNPTVQRGRLPAGTSSEGNRSNQKLLAGG